MIEDRLAKLPPRPPVTKGGKRRDRRANGFTLVWPKIDYLKLTGALLQHARNEEEKEAAGDDLVHR